MSVWVLIARLLVRGPGGRGPDAEQRTDAPSEDPQSPLDIPAVRRARRVGPRSRARSRARGPLLRDRAARAEAVEQAGRVAVVERGVVLGGGVVPHHEVALPP